MSPLLHFRHQNLEQGRRGYHRYSAHGLLWWGFRKRLRLVLSFRIHLSLHVG